MLKRTSRILSLLLTLMLMFSAMMPAYAAEDSLIDAQLLTESIQALSDVGDTIEEDTSLPAVFDLRNVNGQNFVTPIKSQGLLGSCWAFASTAAMETSLIYEFWQEQGVNLSNVLDLSEHHLAWFGKSHITEATGTLQSQLGEGFYMLTSDNQMDTGGTASIAASLIMSGSGPALESDYPYSNKSGKMIDVSQDKEGYYVYAVDGEDWSLEDADRFTSIYDLSEASALPSPASFSYDDQNNLIYSYDESATQAIKSELYSGRAVAVSYYCYAGGSLEDQEDAKDDSEDTEGNTEDSNVNVKADGNNMNADTFAVYTYYPSLPNHGVTIVGWDDSYSRDNFGVEGDETTKPQNDGAWIVKNSWGALGNEVPNLYDWGIDGTGYFYISYEDQSLVMPQTYDFDLDTEVENRIINQYDTMPVQAITQAEDVISYANVFTAESNQEIYAISSLTANPGSTVKYQLYLLDQDYSGDPTNGTLVYEASEAYTYGGYHRIELDEPILMTKGQTYSVVQTLSAYDAETDQTVTYMPLGLSYNESIVTMYQTETNYAKGVINLGESYVLSNENGETIWSDWGEMVNYLYDIEKSACGFNTYAYDNFSIKTYATPYVPEVVIEKIDGKPDEEKTYEAGDTVTFEFDYVLPTFGDDISTQSEDEDADKVNVSLSDTLGTLSDDQKSMSLKAGETKTVSTNYTLKEEDVQDGKITQTFTLVPDSDEFKTSEVTYTLTVKTSANTDNTDTSSNSTSSDSTANKTASNAKTGVETDNTAVYMILAVLIVAVLAAVVVFSKKNAKQQ